MNQFGSHLNHENRPPYEGPRLRASPRHGGQGVQHERVLQEGIPVGWLKPFIIIF